MTLYGYEEIYGQLQTLPGGWKVHLNKEKVNARLLECLPEDAEILDQSNLTLLLRRIKNKTEVENEKIAISKTVRR